MTSSLRTPLWIIGISVLLAIVAGGITSIVMAAANAPSDEIPQSVLHSDTRMGAVELQVRDMQAMREYYGENGVGLQELGEADGILSLGVDGEEIIRLVPSEGEDASPTDAGLYHSAVVFPNGAALAETVVRMAPQYSRLFQGATDHAVSEAFYFADPEGNGVELYIDTPREEWVWENGQVQMGSAALDPNAFISEHLGGGGSADGSGTGSGETTMGHVHLKVGNVEQAREFYVDTLGFAVTAEVDGALFMSAGGYHHHLAANTWGSAGAGARPAGLGLGSFEVLVPSASEIDSVVTRLQDAGLPFEQTDAGLTIADPWDNQVRFTVAD